MPATPTDRLASLHALRDATGPARTVGLSDDVLRRFLQTDPSLGRAIDEAVAAHQAIAEEHPDWLAMDEGRLGAFLQSDYVNFYGATAVNPYVAVAARGPWIVTLYGAVVHDNGGYGMLGLGHSPDAVIDELPVPWVIANIMTPSPSHKRFAHALRTELGHTRADGCPFDRFLCMNSGSEAVGVAMRISDIGAALAVAPGGSHPGQTVKVLAIEGGFHGGTYRPATASPSSRAAYARHLHSFGAQDRLDTVPSNDIPALEAAFAKAREQGVFYELMLMEPVMGEGNPGQAVTRAFYDAARRLTLEHGTLLLVDSIQAGIRSQGVLSLMDYPGFRDAPPPDMETWSKALNAAQYPLSVLGMTERAAGLYRTGVYGNTMTANPRALEVGRAVLDGLTPALRANIVDRGVELVDRLKALQAELPDVITKVQGTGLLLSAELAPGYDVVGAGAIEEQCRVRGLGVIHGGVNSLRFTPWFGITSEECALVVEIVGDVLREVRAAKAA